MLILWTIYKNPSDYPLLYVARPFNARTSKPIDIEKIVLSPNLEPLQDFMKSKNLFRLNRSPNDDPIIVESWV